MNNRRQFNGYIGYLRRVNMKAGKYKILGKIELCAGACLVNVLLSDLNRFLMLFRFDMRLISLNQGYWLSHEPKQHGHKQQ